MHELSVAQGILDIVHQYVPASDSGRVSTVFVKVGALAGVVPESLEFSFAAITADTPLKNARLQIERIPFIIECKDCARTSESDEGIIICPACGGMNTKTLSGTELQVSEIEINDPTEVPA